MLLTLLLLSQVGCEWVQISQQHYHKPILYNHPLTTSNAKELEKKTKTNRIYINNSLPEYTWNKGTVYNPETSDVKRGQLVRSTVTPFGNQFDNANEKHPSTDVTEYGYNNNRVQHATVLKPDLVKNLRVTTENEKLTYPYNDKVERIPPIDTPKDNSRNEINTERPIEVLNLSDIEYVTEEDGFKTIELDDDILISNNGQKRIKHIKGGIITSDQINGGTKSNRLAENKLRNSEILKHDRHEYEETKPTYKKQITFTGIGKMKSDIEIPNIGNVKQIHFMYSTETPVRGIERKQIGIINALDESSFGLVEKGIIIEGSLNPEETLQRFPNIGNINRVQLVKTPMQTSQRFDYENKEGGFSYASNMDSVTNGFNNNVKESKKRFQNISYIEKDFIVKPTGTKNGQKNHTPLNRLNAPNPEDIMIQEILMEDENKMVDKNNSVSNIGMVNKIHQISKVKDTPVKISPNNDGAIRTSVKLNPEKTVFVNQDEYANVGHSTNTENVQSNESTKDVTFLPNRNKTKIKVAVETGAKVKPINKSLTNVFHAQKPVSKVSFSGDDYKNDFLRATTYKHKFNTDATPTESAKNRVNIKEDNKESESISKSQNNKKAKHDPKTGNVSADTKTNTMENVVKLIKIVTDTISINTRRSFNSKMRYLQELKDTILANIEDRIESAFPDEASDGARRRRRRARTAHAQAARGHVEFPSSESALMTISFLTFAVFLIKLVVQVIHTYKNKAMVMPAVVATVGRAASSAYTHHHHRDQN